MAEEKVLMAEKSCVKHEIFKIKVHLNHLLELSGWGKSSLLRAKHFIHLEKEVYYCFPSKVVKTSSHIEY